MFEITYNDKSKFQKLIDDGTVHKTAVYDFTFEKKFYIYHELRLGRITYISLDKKAKLGSIVCTAKEPLNCNQYKTMVSDILRSIKYTGDRRYSGGFSITPDKFIDLVFKTVMPNYGFAVRNEQIVMAKSICHGLESKTVTLCEAEVGTGKTMAYLIGSLALKMFDQSYSGTGLPITITTSSIELQKMIIEKEIPMLSKMLIDYGFIRNPLSAVLRKGKEHYFCPERYEDFIRALHKYPKKYSELTKKIEALKLLNRCFDLDNFSGLGSSIKSKICVKGSCTNCPKASECKYSRYLDRALNRYTYQFQVTNHNMYLASLLLKKNRAYGSNGILQSSELCIIDEAHKIPETAYQAFGKQIESTAVEKYTNEVKYLCNSDKISLCKFRSLLSAAEKTNITLFDSLRKSTVSTDDESGKAKVRITPKIKKAIGLLCSQLREISNYCRDIPSYRGVQCEAIIQSLESFLETDSIIYWLDITEDDSSVTLCSIPKSLNDVMLNTVWDDGISHKVLTSGTMRDDTGFEYFKSEVGIANLAKSKTSEYSFKSPFDYANNTRLYISNNVPYPDNEDETYLQAVADEIEKLVKAAHGHTAILFTSYKVLSNIYDKLCEKLDDYPLIKMTRSNRTAISDFKKSKNGVLFASGAMWEGVDCIGDILSSVIIVKLPFPLRNEILERKKQKCNSTSEFIQTYAVPQMVIKLRQGVGRLVRCENDTGIISILDSRAAPNGNHRARTLAVLGNYPLVSSIEEVGQFISSVKSPEYFQTT